MGFRTAVIRLELERSIYQFGEFLRVPWYKFDQRFICLNLISIHLRDRADSLFTLRNANIFQEKSCSLLFKKVEDLQQIA